MHVTPRARSRASAAARGAAALAALVGLLSACGGKSTTIAGTGSDQATAWLCRPGATGDPCAFTTRVTVLPAKGTASVVAPAPQTDLTSKFDCFYIYPTVSTESSTNADLRVQPAEVEAARVQVSPFSDVCRIWSPVYRQITTKGLVSAYVAGPDSRLTTTAYSTAYDSLKAGFEDYLRNDNDGRPLVILAHSQGAVIAIQLLQQLFDQNPSLKSRLVMAVILGGNVTVAPGSTAGGSFSNISLCTRTAQVGCVLAYSSFPSQPPADAFFGIPRPVIGGHATDTSPGTQVACTNPAALNGGSGQLEPWFPTDTRNAPVGVHLSTPWVTYPHLYTASCQKGGGASWLQVTPIPGAAGGRPLIAESSQLGPRWGYHVADFNLAEGNLLADVAAAEQAWRAPQP